MRPPHRGCHATVCTLPERSARSSVARPITMDASSPSDRWCSSPPTPATPGCWSPADQLAARLAAGGDPRPVYIEQTETRYAIGWQGRYQIEAQMFIYEDTGSDRLTAIQGYPVQRLLRAIDEANRH